MKMILRRGDTLRNNKGKMQELISGICGNAGRYKKKYLAAKWLLKDCSCWTLPNAKGQPNSDTEKFLK